VRLGPLISAYPTAQAPLLLRSAVRAFVPVPNDAGMGPCSQKVWAKTEVVEITDAMRAHRRGERGSIESVYRQIDVSATKNGLGFESPGIDRILENQPEISIQC
jgi:hypothetical protein